MHRRPTIDLLSAQRGAALVVSMVMLLVITVIGIAVMGGSRLELLMANNSHLQTDAYRNAEIALAAGLDPTTSIINPPSPLPIATTAANPLLPKDLADVAKWSDGTIVGIPVATTTGSAAYVMQYLGCSQYTTNGTPYVAFVPNTCSGSSATNVIAYIYRVWALGTDGKGAARILQSTRVLINTQAPVGTLTSGGPPAALPILDNRVELPSS